jgi:hypothetical protein
MPRGVRNKVSDVRKQLEDAIDRGSVRWYSGRWQINIANRSWRRVSEEMGYLLEFYTQSEKAYIADKGIVKWKVATR